jgi:D-serine deaminase-like pyridoxal phosphate-dependent protein
MDLPSYQAYRQAFAGQPMPYAFVDLDLFDANVRAIGERAQGKKVRVATKSIRSVEMIRRVLAGHPAMQGLMTFTVEETVWLSQLGFDDLLLAYPTWNEAGIRAICQELKKGKRIRLMLDSAAHAAHFGKIADSEQVEMPVCLDLDLSSSYPGLRFGVNRSPVDTVQKALEVWKAVQNEASLKLEGVMGYEAQIAGLGDDVPGMGIKGPVVRLLKRKSIKEVQKRRLEVVEALRKAGAPIVLVNGGGTGSMESTRLEGVVTEITAGSGFFSSHLFDYYRNFRHLPAAAYAIEVVRIPKEGIFTCLGGGYVASGGLGIEKLPLPYLPAGSKLLPNEGAGEVQTPIEYKGPEKLELGSPVFMRHSKAGELCERFNDLLLFKQGKLEGKTPTYRGEGKCFL